MKIVLLRKNGGIAQWLPYHPIRPCRMTWEHINNIVKSIVYYVYYLLMNNGQIYTGSTSNLQNRIYEHERGAVNTTSKYLPVRLIGYESYLLKSDAQRREKFMKTTEGKRLFRQQFRDVLSK